MFQHSSCSILLAIGLSAVYVLTAVPNSRAQDATLTGELPDSIIVTAHRYPEHVTMSGRRVAVWTAADLDRLPVSGYDELLRTVAGVEVLSRGGFGVQSDISMRGSTFNGVLVLLDGLRLNDPMTGHFLADLPVPMSEIARVEVVRGPAAAVYGPDALGGVIQLFTHAGFHRARPSASSAAGGLNMDARASGGDHGLYGFDGAVRSLSSERHVSVAAAFEGADGPHITNRQGQPVVGMSGSVRSDFKRNAQTVALVQNVGSGRFNARAGRDHREFGAYHYYTPFASDTAREQTETLWLQAGVDGRRGATHWRVQGALKQHDDRYVYNPVTSVNEHRSRLGQIHGFAVREISSSMLMTAGAGATWRSIDSNNLGRHSDGAAGVFSSLRWQPRPPLSVTGSARFDYDEAFGTAFTPQLAAVLYGGRFGLHAVAGRAVRSPNYIERFFNTTLARPRGRSVGHPNLQPERAWTYEAGASFYPWEGVALHATGFLRYTSDLIDYARLSPADTIFLARNLHNVRTTGLEVDASIQRMLGAHRLRADAAYTLLDADLGALDDQVEYKYVLTNARHIAQFALTYSAGASFGGLQALHRDPLDGDAYTVVHARAGYSLDAGTGRLQFSVELRNLFDRTYSEVFDAPALPRWWLLRLRYVR